MRYSKQVQNTTYKGWQMSDFATQCLQTFHTICSIPHCSFQTQDMFSYICDTLKNKGYEVHSDEAKNIYAKKGNPKVCLQSHYDMVCVGDSAKNLGVETIEKDGFLYAKNSSLGADNGIGVACMLTQDLPDIELLFTNDEEVGMIGANHLKLGIASNLLLNLDSEAINEIVLGCAGGADIECAINLEHFSKPLDSLSSTHPHAYHITSRGFLGGHSGIDIHKNKENALVEYCFFLSSLEAYIVTLSIGEKRNSIPASVDSIIVCNKELPTKYNISHNIQFDISQIQSLNTYSSAYHKDAIVPLVCSIHSGVYAISKQGVLSSLNLSLLYQKEQYLHLIMMARANTDALLQRTISRLQTCVPRINPHCTININGYYSPWEKSISKEHKALNLLCQIYEKHNITPHLAQIHAGLECGILKKQILANTDLSHLDVISIGPTINAPHSCEESLHLGHFEQFCMILEDFITSYKG